MSHAQLDNIITYLRALLNQKHTYIQIHTRRLMIFLQITYKGGYTEALI